MTLRLTTLILVLCSFCAATLSAQGTYGPAENTWGTTVGVGAVPDNTDPTASCVAPGSGIENLQIGDAIINEFIIRTDDDDNLDAVLSAFHEQVSYELQAIKSTTSLNKMSYKNLGEPTSGSVAKSWSPGQGVEKSDRSVKEVLVTIPLSAAQDLDDSEVLCNIYGNTFGASSGTHGDGTTWPNYRIGTGEVLETDICEVDCLTGKPVHAPNAPAYDPLQSCTTDGDMIAGLWPSAGGGRSGGGAVVHAAIFDTPVNLSGYAAFNGLRVEPANAHDPSGHGSAVAALMVQDFVQHGNLNKVVIHSYPVLDKNGRGDLATLLAAMNEALEDNRIKLWNLSLGFSPNTTCDKTTVTAISEALNRAAERDIFVVSSAGNAGRDINVEPQHPAADKASAYTFTVGSFECGSRSSNTPPYTEGGMYPYNLGMAGIGEYPEATTAPYSNVSYNLVDVLAPGENIFVPNVVAGCYFYVEGTSFAAPLISSILLRGLTLMSPSNTLCEFRSQRLYSLGRQSDARYQLLSVEQDNLLAMHCSDNHTEPRNLGQYNGFGGFKNAGSPSNKDGAATLLYPNPTSDRLNVKLNQATKGFGRATIFDSVGAAVAATAFSGPRFDLDVSALAKGVYSIRINVAGQTETHRFVKQ